MIKGYILPMGTVVKVKNGEQKAMIIGRAQLFKDNDAMGYFDYCAVPYPQGPTGESEFGFFNDEDVAEVIFEGYRSEDEIEFANSYEETVKKAPYPKLQVGSS